VSQAFASIEHMFDTGLMGVGAPLTLAVDRRLDVLPALESVLPDGLQRGTIVGVSGTGALSLALALVAGATSGDTWAAMVGCEDLCLAAAEGMGVPLHRLVTVSRPDRSQWSTVVGALLDSFEIVLVAPTSRVGTSDARRLRHRARERGSVLVDVSRVWPDAHDLSLTITDSQWSGLGDGHGFLEARRVEIRVDGRRGVMGRTVPLWLPGPDGIPEAIDQNISNHAGGDIESIVGVSPSAQPVPLRSVG
jgi:hypothetical protein